MESVLLRLGTEGMVGREPVSKPDHREGLRGSSYKAFRTPPPSPAQRQGGPRWCMVQGRPPRSHLLSCPLFMDAAPRGPVVVPSKTLPGYLVPGTAGSSQANPGVQLLQVFLDTKRDGGCPQPAAGHGTQRPG